MNIRRFINQNSEKIWKIIGIIAFAFFLIKGLNFYYEKSEEAKKQQMSESLKNNNNKGYEKPSIATIKIICIKENINVKIISFFIIIYDSNLLLHVVFALYQYLMRT